MRFKIVMAGRDCYHFVQRSLESVAAQFDHGFDVCVIDDASEDPRQPELMERLCGNFRWQFIHNDQHQGALYNHVAAVRLMAPDPEDVIVSIDADDRLSGPHALARLRQYYKRYNPLLTYGSYRSDPADWRVQPAKHLPDQVVLDNSYRAFSARKGEPDPVWFNHLRTLKHHLFTRLDPGVDFVREDGSWLRTCYDLAITIPALELASGRHLMLPDVLYIYTRDNPRSDCYVNQHIIEVDKQRIFGLPPKQPLHEIVVPPRVDSLP